MKLPRKPLPKRIVDYFSASRALKESRKEALSRKRLIQVNAIARKIALVAERKGGFNGLVDAASILIDHGLYSDAARVYEKLANTSQGYSGFYNEAGRFYEKAGKLKQAIEAYRKSGTPFGLKMARKLSQRI